MIGRLVKCFEPQMIISLFYPASTDTPLTDFFDLYRPRQKEAAALLTEMGVKPDNLRELIQNMGFGSIEPSATAYPVILLAPGFGVERDMYLKIIRSLVAQKYIVVTIGAPSESIFTVFPDGTFVRQDKALSDLESLDYERWHKILGDRSRAIFQTLAYLETLNQTDSTFRGLLNLDKVAAMGHSLGGAAVFEALKQTKDLKAAVMLDPSFHLIKKDGQEITDPLLVLRQDASSYEAMAAIMNPLLARDYIDGQQYVSDVANNVQLYKVDGSHHMSFSDIPVYSGEPEAYKIYASIEACLTRFLEQSLNETQTQLLPGDGVSLINGQGHLAG